MRFIDNPSCQIWLMGGLGNQLFQLNYGIWLMNKIGRPIAFNTYLTRHNFVTKLLKWSIHDALLEQLIDINTEITNIRNIPAILLCKAPICSASSHYAGLYDIPKSAHRNLFGYFQNRKFLAETQASLSLKSGILENCKQYDTVMHLRGGDMNNREYGLSYYSHVLEHLHPSRIHVVTDCSFSLERLKNNFKKHELLDVGGSAYQDFLTCCSAKTLVTAPSTFSWWAARLGNAKKIVMPLQTYNILGSPTLRDERNMLLL